MKDMAALVHSSAHMPFWTDLLLSCSHWPLLNLHNFLDILFSFFSGVSSWSNTIEKCNIFRRVIVSPRKKLIVIRGYLFVAPTWIERRNAVVDFSLYFRVLSQEFLKAHYHETNIRRQRGNFFRIDLDLATDSSSLYSLKLFNLIHTLTPCLSYWSSVAEQFLLLRTPSLLRSPSYSYLEEWHLQASLFIHTMVPNVV